MKYEIGEKRPEHFKEYWPGMYDCFSHYEYVSNVPQVLFLITTINENGKTNACLHSWSAFSGDSGGFFVVLTGLPPRIKEAFLSYECKLHNHDDLSGKGISAIIVGRVVNTVIEGSHDNPEELCGEKSFMYYIHAPKNPETGEGAEAGVIAALNPVRPD